MSGSGCQDQDQGQGQVLGPRLGFRVSIIILLHTIGCGGTLRQRSEFRVLGEEFGALWDGGAV